MTRSTLPRLSPQRRLAWLLWLALLLPLAHTAAACHAATHAMGDAQRDSQHAPASLAAPCDLCLMAAGLADGAAPSSASEVAAQPAASAPQWTAPLRQPSLPLALAYRSQAPPQRTAL